MNFHKLSKIITIAQTYGWIAFLYGTLFTFIPDAFGAKMHPILQVGIPIVTAVLGVWYAYKLEMRMYMPALKYWTFVLFSFVGVFALINYTYLYPLWYGVLMVALRYKCRDCVAFSRSES